MDIQTVLVAGNSRSSLIVLRTHAKEGVSPVRLPIRIGPVEASAISMGLEGSSIGRPVTHDLLATTISALGGRVVRVEICAVHDTTFFSKLILEGPAAKLVEVDARPSDAIALAVRTHVPIYASEDVLEAAALPDFDTVEADKREQDFEDFHAFVEELSPEDFSNGTDRP